MLGFCLMFLCLNTVSAQSLSLKDVYVKALEETQTSKLSNVRTQLSKDASEQDRSSYYPTIGVKGTVSKADQSVSQKALGLNMTANLYNGGKDGLTVENSKLDQSVANNQNKVEALKLYLEVIDLFYNALLNKKDLSNLELLYKQSLDRSNEIKKRVQIGRSRIGESLQAEAQLASVEAQLVNAKELVKTSEAKLSMIAGVEVKDLSELIFDESINEKSYDELINSALLKEEYANKKLAIEKLQNNINSSKRHYLPKLDLSSNLYALKEGSTSYEASKWDVGLTLTIPLFEGGESVAALSEDVNKKLMAELEYRESERELKVDVRQSYDLFKRYQNQLSVNEKALTLSKRSYDETLRDYRLGLVSNLDVLSSLNLYLDRKRESEKNKILMVMYWKMLEAKAGQLP